MKSATKLYRCKKKTLLFVAFSTTVSEAFRNLCVIFQILRNYIFLALVFRNLPYFWGHDLVSPILELIYFSVTYWSKKIIHGSFINQSLSPKRFIQSLKLGHSIKKIVFWVFHFLSKRSLFRKWQIIEVVFCDEMRKVVLLFLSGCEKFPKLTNQHLFQHSNVDRRSS